MRTLLLSVVCTFFCIFFGGTAVAQDESQISRLELIRAAVGRLIELQEPDGAWPYEGVYRVKRKIPVGYRIGGSAIVCTALLSSDLDEQRSTADEAIAKSVDLIISELDDPLMTPSAQDRYDVRVWGHIYALDLFCRIKSNDNYEHLNEKTEPLIQRMVNALMIEEIDGGGWNYASQKRHAAFVTGPALQALLLAKEHGIEISDEIFARGVNALNGSRSENGAYQYSGVGQRDTKLPGSIARSALCESTLIMLGVGDQKELQASLDAFHEHWIELEKRRQKTGTHVPPYGVAPYYFYFGHRYAAQAIQLLPTDDQEAEFVKFEKVLMKTLDDDNTWNDRVFDRSKAYGTAMSVLALSRDRVINPTVSEVVPNEKKDE